MENASRSIQDAINSEPRSLLTRRFTGSGP
jgi:hypothetical protein